MGGDLTTYNGATMLRMGRLNADGSRDTSFVIGSGIGGGGVYSLAVQNDGKIFVAGMFTSYNGITTNRLVRLNADGNRDTSFVSGNGLNAAVRSSAVQSDGKIIVGGDFTNYNGVITNRIIRLNPDGSRDTSFQIGTGFNSGVNSIAIQADGKLVIGGNFSSYNGISAGKIIRLNPNGSVDTSFVTGAGFIFSVNSIAIHTDGKIIVGGSFTTFNGLSTNRIARLNIDGSRDTSFQIGTGFNSRVNSIAIQSDGKILVGGGFTSYNKALNNRIIRLNADGRLNSNFVTGTGFNSNVHSVAIQSDGDIIVGGQFFSYNGVGSQYITKLKNNGEMDTSFSGSLFNNLVYSVTLQNNGKIIVGGEFTAYKDTAATRLIRLDNFVKMACDTTILANGSSCAILNVAPGALNMYAGDAVDNNDLCSAGFFDTITTRDDSGVDTLLECSEIEQSVNFASVNVLATRQTTATSIFDILFEDLTGSNDNVYNVSVTFSNIINKSSGSDLVLGSNPDSGGDESAQFSYAPSGADSGKLYCYIDPATSGSIRGIASNAAGQPANQALFTPASASTITSTTAAAGVFGNTSPSLAGRYDIDNVDYECRLPGYLDAGRYTQQLSFTVVAY